jgi:hypothetical protein
MLNDLKFNFFYNLLIIKLLWIEAGVFSTYPFLAHTRFNRLWALHGTCMRDRLCNSGARAKNLAYRAQIPPAQRRCGIAVPASCI